MDQINIADEHLEQHENKYIGGSISGNGMLDESEVMLLWVSEAENFQMARFYEKREEFLATFQKMHKLPVTDEIDEGTAKEIERIFSFSLNHLEMYPRSVRTFKKCLNHLGFGGIQLSGNLGDFAIKRMNEFQLFYGLNISDNIDLPTLQKMIELESSPIRLGNRHHELIPLKEMLNMLEFGPITLTDKFGKRLKGKVNEFQRAHNYPINGMMDTTTADKIREVFFTKVNTPSGRFKCIRGLKQKLNRLGFGKIMLTNKLGPYTVKKISEFQTVYKLPDTGEVDQQTFDKMMELLMSPLRIGRSHEEVVSLREDLTELGYGPFKMIDKFDVVLEKGLKKFQRTYQLPASGIADDLTLETLRNAVKYKEKLINRQYDITLGDALGIQMENEAFIMDDVDSPDDTRNATREEVEFYLDPTPHLTSEKNRFQFLNLTLPEVTSVSSLNRFLADKGSLAGTGQQFLDAGKEYGVNEVFLIYHALLATDNGQSQLAAGVQCEDDEYLSGKKVFNVYGFHEGSEDTLEAKMQMAVKERWTTVDRAIMEGALLLKEKYLSNSLDTFYKMRWDPDNMVVYKKPGAQTEKDITWAIRQAEHVYQIYRQLDGYTLYLDFPNYE